MVNSGGENATVPGVNKLTKRFNLEEEPSLYIARHLHSLMNASLFIVTRRPVNLLLGFPSLTHLVSPE